MSKPAVFFDRDNTLIISDGYLGDPAQVQLAPGASEAVARAQELGFAVVTVSNQSGVGRGLMTEEDVENVNKKMDAMLRLQNPKAIINRHEFCPFHPEATIEKYRQESDLRKPKPGMLKSAAKSLGLDLEASWLIGDSPRDIEAGFAAGCRTILLANPSIPPSPAASEPSSVDPDETVGTLTEAMDIIEAAEAAKSAVAHGAPVGRTFDLTGRRKNPRHDTFKAVHFSTSKLLAGIVQIFALAVAVLAIFENSFVGTPTILFAIFLQMFVIALILMDIDERR